MSVVTKPMGTSFNFDKVWSVAPDDRFGKLSLIMDANDFYQSANSKNLKHFCWKIHIWAASHAKSALREFSTFCVTIQPKRGKGVLALEKKTFLGVTLFNQQRGGNPQNSLPLPFSLTPPMQCSRCGDRGLLIMSYTVLGNASYLPQHRKCQQK